MSALLVSFVTRTVTLLGLCALIGCVSPEQQATRAGFVRTPLTTDSFELHTWHRGLGTPTSALHVYVEGDGRAFTRAGRLSRNPTPRKAVGMSLARADLNRAVLYLGRPCQYLSRKALAKCDPMFWSTHRFAEQVIEAMSSAVDSALSNWPEPPLLVMIGYSGGGSVAALVAARRSDVSALITLAANLDHRAWTAHHNVPPLLGSLNPSAAPNADLGRLPQLHFAGGQDKVVPTFVVERFVRAHNAPRESLRVVEHYNHACCWAELWPAPLCELVTRNTATLRYRPADFTRICPTR